MSLPYGVSSSPSCPRIFETNANLCPSQLAAAYSLTLGSCILPAGRLGDMFGHRKIFFTGWIWFAATSLLCGFSILGGPRMFTTCRAFQGIGPALLTPNGLALFGQTFPIGMKRNIATSIFGGSGPCGVVTGAVMTSVFDQLVWWPWSFWSMGIACCDAHI